ncbi:MAG: YIP1 family protein [Nanoarchaeota archaeon]|nr:YIP1 family protein [Nanoarchaeota archaeon]
MGYWQDMFDILLLKDEAYRRVGNDAHAFKRVSGYLLLSFFCVALFIGALVALGFSFIRAYLPVGEIPADIGGFLSLIFIAMVVFMPLLLYAFEYVSSLIPHGIGLLCGGKPKGYHDFFKVASYPLPVVYPLMILFNVLQPVFMIWWFFVLYKSYRVIHKLSPRNSGLAVALNILLVLIVIVTITVLVFSLFMVSPEFAAQVAARGY